MKAVVLALAVASLTLVSACGNKADQSKLIATYAKNTVLSIGKKRAPAPAQLDLTGAINTAMKSTDKPLTAVVIEGRDGFAVLSQFSTNNGYITWASADRRSITTKQGVITATRGLGFDLMSADISNSLPNIRARRSGATSRTLRFLDGENQTVEAVFSCATKVTGTQAIAIGDIRSNVTTVLETCRSNDQSFENTYQVSPSGYVLQSRQWIGAANGYMFLQALRLN